MILSPHDEKYIPVDIFKQILFELPASTILNTCLTNKISLEICNDENFWKEYIDKNYDTEELSMLVVGFVLQENQLWNIISNRAGIMPRQWRKLALFLEEGKIITYQNVDSEGIIHYARPYFLSAYERIGRFVIEGESILRGKTLIVVQVNGYIIVKPIDQDVSLQLTVTENTLIRDIKYKNIKLIDDVEEYVIY